jgi:protein involved in sex pheromone biosynthesis
MRSILLIIFTVIVLLLTACTGEADPDHTDGSDKADASIEQDGLEDAVPDTV